MNHLQAQIHRIEQAIQIETAYIRTQHEELQKAISASNLVPYTLLGSLVVGFLFARKLTFKQLILKLGYMTLVAKRFYKRAKPLLPFI